MTLNNPVFPSDHPLKNTPTILVHVNFHKTQEEEYLVEFRELAASAGVIAVDLVQATRSAPDPKYFVGKGKAQQILESLKAHDAHMVLFNHALSPSQKRSLEQLYQCRVLDRTELILEIFAARARTFEGKLQVELAQLQYLATRLVRGWTHLERQKGGIGLRGGPGEKQLEVDRRLLRNRIKAITQRLEKVRKQRSLSRRTRQRSAVPTVALVGYTNAGKSTLFNRLTHAEVEVADKLFATLDPTLRRIQLPELGSVVLADTVGFIRDLPHHLVEAFRATLEEVLSADLLLHVVDAHNPEKRQYIEAVNEVIEQLGAEKVPQLLVYNKLDLVPGATFEIEYNPQGLPTSVAVSAVTGEGIDILKQAIKETLAIQHE
ncbi:MAG: GTPase HflX [Gammaproteobacteria bacterium]